VEILAQSSADFVLT